MLNRSNLQPPALYRALYVLLGHPLLVEVGHRLVLASNWQMNRG
jgi:hypothetical protein